MSHQPPPLPEDGPPGVFAQFGTTKDAAVKLAMAHVDLAKAEASAIGGHLARLIGALALALALVVLAAILFAVGTSLFLGEWLLGSMGWGVLHGLLLFIGLALAAVFVAIGLSARSVGMAALGGVAAAVIVGLILGFDLPNRLYVAVGDAVAPTAIEAGVRPLAVGIIVGAIVGLVVGVVLALRGLGWPALIGLLVLGAAVGAFSAVTFGPRIGAGLGIAVGYLTWIGAMAAVMAGTGVDTEALKQRFYPTQTIDTSKETLEWLKTRLPRANRS